MLRSIVILTSSFSLAVRVKVFTRLPLAILTKVSVSVGVPWVEVTFDVLAILCSKLKEGKSVPLASENS